MSEPTKRALLIGIDEYDVERWRLYGCENDSRAIESVLLDPFGFAPENITMVLNGEATRERILKEFETLIEQTQPGDIVVTHYAGHGSQMTDLENDEPDGKDETIVTHDSHHSGDKPNLDINDDEIHDLLLRLTAKTDYVTMIFDCCHSGTMTRDLTGEEARSVEGDTRTGPEMGREPLDPATRSTGSTSRGPSGWLPLSDKYVLIAGCRDEEKSYEKRVTIGEETIKHGSLTYHLCEQLRLATSGTTYRDVFEAAAASVTAHKARQHPQMEGAVDREIFGIHDIEPMKFIRVSGRDGDVVTLAGGAIHGITVGSKWGVYAAAAKVADPELKLGTIEITSVGPVTTRATIVSGSEAEAGAIDDSARAVVEEHNYGDLRLSYALKADATVGNEVEALSAALAEMAQLRKAEDGEVADVTIYLVAPRQAVGAEDPVPQLGSVTEPTWAAVGEDGEVAMPTKAIGAWAGDESGRGGIPNNLCLLASARRALELDNPDPNSVLRGKVTFELLRGARTDDGVAWSIAHPESAGGQIVYESGSKDADGKPVYGDFIAFRIKNNHTERVYVTLVNIDAAGAIGIVYPPKGAEGPVEPGGEFEYGNRDSDKPRDLVMPASYPFYRSDDDGVVEGTETFKLFVTPEHVDFRYAEQEAMRSLKPRPAIESVWRTATEPATRGLREEEEEAAPVKVAENDWATVTRAVTLRKAARIRPDGSALALRGATVRLPGIEGEARVHDRGSDKLASVEANSPALAGVIEKLTPALEQAGMKRTRTVEIAGRRTEAASRSVGDGAGQIVTVPTPGPNMGQALLVTDERGLVRWQYPSEAEGGRGLDGERALSQEFVLDDYVLEDSGPSADLEGAAQRGLVGEIGKHLFNVVVFPLIEEGIGEIGEAFAAKWEAKKRPYRVRRFGPDDYQSPEAPNLDAEGWRNMASGRALMMVHGTFSRAHSAFGGMPRAQVEELYRAYDGRVFAFDHWTMAHDPVENIKQMLEPRDGALTPIPEGTALDIDIICHSRGGLVSRVLSEMRGELSMGSRSIDVGRVIFVGSPNGGTAFASKEHIKKYLDRITNIFTLVAKADNTGTVETLEAVFTAVKTLAVGAFGGLDGIQCMAPGSEFMRRLDTQAAHGTRYFALASDYAADPTGIKSRFMDLAVDRLLFGNRGNDLVVPTESVYDRRSGLGDAPAEERRAEGASNGNAFPISERLVYEGGVDHSGYFATPRSHKQIMEWLSA